MTDKTVTDKANEQGWGSTVNAAAEKVKNATDSIAESIRGKTFFRQRPTTCLRPVDLPSVLGHIWQAQLVTR